MHLFSLYSIKKIDWRLYLCKNTENPINWKCIFAWAEVLSIEADNHLSKEVVVCRKVFSQKAYPLLGFIHRMMNVFVCNNSLNYNFTFNKNYKVMTFAKLEPLNRNYTSMVEYSLTWIHGLEIIFPWHNFQIKFSQSYQVSKICLKEESRGQCPMVCLKKCSIVSVAMWSPKIFIFKDPGRYKVPIRHAFVK